MFDRADGALDVNADRGDMPRQHRIRKTALGDPLTPLGRDEQPDRFFCEKVTDDEALVSTHIDKGWNPRQKVGVLDNVFVAGLPAAELYCMRFKRC